MPVSITFKDNLVDMNGFSENYLQFQSDLFGVDKIEDSEQADEAFVERFVEFYSSWEKKTEEEKEFCYQNYIKAHPGSEMSFKTFKVAIRRSTDSVVRHIRSKVLMIPSSEKLNTAKLKVVLRAMMKEKDLTPQTFIQVKEGIPLYELLELFPGLEDYLEM